MASPRSRYTLLVPTFNRAACLRSLIGYLAARRFEYPICVLDSSSGEALAQNRETVGRGGLDIVHEIYDPTTPIYKKLELALGSVESTYCSFCADDDVLFTDHLSGLFDVLDANPALVVAHGYYVNFKPGEDFELSYTDYSAPSIVADDALKRIVEQMRCYQAIFYGVHRTSTMRSILPPLDRVKSLWAKELLTSSLTLINGGAYRIPQYYMARRIGPSIASEGWHPHHFLAIDPAGLLREYADYRGVTLEHLVTDAQCRDTYQIERMQRVFDLVHLEYLASMLSTGILDYLVRESLRSDGTSRDMIAGMWKQSVSASDGEPGQLRRYLARARRLLRPTGSAEDFSYLQRLASLYSALKFREKLDVSFGPMRNRMMIKRKTRSGRSRGYVMARAFLTQTFVDRGQVTASHLRTIIDHLDDYMSPV